MLKVLEQPLFIRIFHWSLVGATFTVLPTSFIKSFKEYNFLGWQDTTLSLFHQASGFMLFLLLLIRIYYSLIKGTWKQIIPQINEFYSIPSFLKYYFFVTEKKPVLFPKYNIGQKIIFSSWGIVILIQTFTGILLAFPVETKTVTSFLFGNLQTARIVHFFVFIYFFSTIFLHIYLVFVEDPARLQAMFTGYIKRKGA